MQRIQHALTAAGATNVDTLDAVFSAPVTQGRRIVVVVRSTFLGNDEATVTDTLGTAYSLVGKLRSRDPYLWIFAGIAPSTGANTVTVTWNSARIYRWIMAIEYEGISVTAESFVSTLGTGVTDMVSDAFSVSRPALVLCVVSEPNATSTYTAGTDFTLIDGAINDGADTFGGVQEYLTTGALNAYVAHITSTGNGNYTMLVAAFAEGAAAQIDWFPGTRIAGVAQPYQVVPCGFRPPDFPDA